jgi:hypothetical protein
MRTRRRRRPDAQSEIDAAAHAVPQRKDAGGAGLAFADNRKEAASLIGLQRLADARGRPAGGGGPAPVQRLADKPATPGGLNDTMKSLEAAVRRGDGAAKDRHFNTLNAANPNYAMQLALYKIQKHRGDSKRALYANLPGGMGKATLQYAIQHQDTVPIGPLSSYLSLFTDAELLQAAQHDEAYFVEHVLTPAKDLNPTMMVPILKKQALMGHLKQEAREQYDAFADATPQLAVVENVMGDMEDLDQPPTNREIADAIFQAVITNTGIRLGYMGTAVSPVEHALTGETSTAMKLRREQKRRNRNIPNIPATDCHHLLTIFQNILQTYPGFTGALDRTTLNRAVLTRPMGQMPGGLIANSFAGNTFDEDNAPTGQIFFTGEDGINSHSWLTVDGRAYDPLFGTTGAAVAQGAAGSYQMERPGVFRNVDRNEYLVKTTEVAVPGNPYSFNTAYKKMDGPREE